MKIRDSRTKVRQTIVVDGHPSCLLRDVELPYYIIIFEDKKFNLGKISEELANIITELCDANPKVELIKSRKIFKSPVNASVLSGMQIKKIRDTTSITISANTEDALMEKLNNLRQYLKDNNIDITERCHWICIADKAKDGKTDEDIILIKKQTDSMDKQMSQRTKQLHDIALKVTGK